MYQQFYRRFLAAHQDQQHFACHSHYFWPDVTRDAMLEFWDDSARLADRKWDFFFTEVIPEVQQYISNTLNTRMPEQIVFAPNTHELIARLLSCLPVCSSAPAPPAILTTDSEFHSVNRQLRRLEEAGVITCERIATQPFDNFEQRFIDALAARQWDMVIFSQVFFNSGYVVKNLPRIVEAVTHSETIIVIDGYHSFMAQPIDLQALAQRVFFIAGGYKYAQAGEGVCFAHVPPDNGLRPAFTGWFAEFGALAKTQQGAVGYAGNGLQFAGATMDFCALYRLRAVYRLLAVHRIEVDDINRHVKAVQEAFLRQLDDTNHTLLNRRNLVVNALSDCGHFLTFEFSDAQTTQQLAEALESQGILTDYRGARLRFGFGMYHDPGQLNLHFLTNI